MIFAQAYPAITRWVEGQGWVEIGMDETGDSLVRALDPGGLVWGSDGQVGTADEALRALEEALREWFEQNGM
ncbi:MAG: hypothetical protein D6723_11810 [Acidobacteria bacterium]|nr:MAG: hypothetical protein D6723_11810 [Acidobacteriota bacterium]